MEIKRETGESYISFAQRVTNAVEDGLIGYDEWSTALLGAVRYSSENLRRAYTVVSQILQNAENDDIEQVDDKDKLAEIRAAINELKAERLKIQTCNLEYNAAQRAEARNDLFNEQIIEAVKRLKPIEPHRLYGIDVLHDEYGTTGTTALLVISDLHAGSTFTIRGYYNEVVNEYSYEIMCQRLWAIIDKMEADDLVFDDLTVAICGDLLENILRESSLVKLREPVVDTAIRLGEFLSNWLVEMSQRLNTRINVVTIGGNHDVVRSITSRPSFEGENLTKIVVELMKLRLADVDWITVDDYQEVAIKTIRGTNIMFQHGEDKDIKTTLDYFSNLYGIDCDEIICGHLHRPESKAVGITDVGDLTLTRIGSIVGTDTFAKKIRVSARPSAYMAMYTDKGKTWSRNYYL